MRKQLLKRIRLVGIVLILVSACSPLTYIPTPSPILTLSPAASPTATPFTEVLPDTTTPSAIPIPPLPTQTLPAPIRFAVIGDYGSGDNNEAKVAVQVQSWHPDFIVTTGDNNYPIGSADTIDENIGKFYHEYIAQYKGKYGKGAVNNLFFPSLGNHDWMSQAAQPYLDYFQLPGNERYYDFTWGKIHFFILDSDSNEPDGVGSSSIQAQWLKSKLQSSTLPWQIVVMHHPPYTSGLRGAVEWMRWPYKEWGADAILCGHDHYYERLKENGLVYFINGAGGGSLYDFGNPTEGSQKRFNGEHGAMLVTADEYRIVFQFFSTSGKLIDQVEINNFK